MAMIRILSAFNIEQIPSISLGTAALLIFGAIASLAVLRGLLRILWGSLAVCISGYAAFVSWQHAAELGRQWLGKETQWLSIVLPSLSFLLCLLALRALGRFVIKPLGESNEETAGKNRSSPIRWALTLLFSLIPTALLWFSGATLLRHFGSVAEIQTYVNSVSDIQNSDKLAFLVRLKEDIEQAIPAEWFQFIDPVTENSRVTLAKLISVADEPPPKAIAVLEIPEIQQLILGDNDLRQLAREGRYSEILRDPRLDRLLENDDLRQVLNGLDL